MNLIFDQLILKFEKKIGYYAKDKVDYDQIVSVAEVKDFGLAGLGIDSNEPLSKYFRGKKNFLERINNVNFANYHLNDPFKESGQALYYWSPIADELKSLDKKIVLNSIHLKWGLMKDEFKKLTKDLKFN